jgi:hypothetical protein
LPEAKAWPLLTRANGGSPSASRPPGLRPVASRARQFLITSATVVVPTKEAPLRDVITRGMRAILTLACLVVAMEGVAAASRPFVAPEISPSSLSVGLGILVSGGLILRSLRRK